MKRQTKVGFRRVIDLGQDVESFEIKILGKKKAFQRQKIDRIVFSRGTYPMRIILEDSPMWK